MASPCLHEGEGLHYAISFCGQTEQRLLIPATKRERIEGERGRKREKKRERERRRKREREREGNSVIRSIRIVVRIT